MSISESAIKRRTEQIGERLAAQRLSRNLTQRDLAASAAISLATLKRLEAGENVSLDTLVRVMGAMDLEGRLELLLPPADVRPVDRVRPAGVERKRATTRPSPRLAPSTPWVWGDRR